ncbi:MAG: flagellar assembly protein FliW [Rickettsiales bacterium]|nr:flagellar assembly protein FliW [Rickettsiales bacterium]
MLHTVTQQPNNADSEVVNAALKQTESSTATIETRFGEIEVSTENPIVFPQGLLGIAGNFEYALTDFPSEKLAQFKLLQSLNDPTVSFITLPVALDNALIDRADIEKAAQDVGVEELDNLTILLIVSVHRSPHDVKVSANTRAPLFVYVPTRTAVQYVFQNSKYKVQEILNFDDE